jgi:tetratricopeptide (TPR) repeat protein
MKYQALFSFQRIVFVKTETIQKLILAIACFLAAHGGRAMNAASIYDAEQARVQANWERSISLCNELLGATPGLSTDDWQHVRFIKAEALLGMKDTNGALRLWQVICLEATESPWRQSALQRQAEVTLFNLKKPTQAKALFEEFLDRYPNAQARPQTWIHLAQARLDTGDAAGALAALDRFGKEFPKHPLSGKAAKLRGRALSSLKPKPSEKPNANNERHLLDSARKLRDAGNAAGALKIYTEIATRPGINDDVRTEADFGRISALESLERYDEAISHSSSLGLRPLSARQKAAHAATSGRLFFLKRNRDADAEKWLRAALALEPPETMREECRHLLLIVLVRQGRAADADVLINAIPDADTAKHYGRIAGRLKGWYSSETLPDEVVLGKQRHRSSPSRLADDKKDKANRNKGNGNAAPPKATVASKAPSIVTETMSLSADDFIKLEGIKDHNEYQRQSQRLRQARRILGVGEDVFISATNSNGGSPTWVLSDPAMATLRTDLSINALGAYITVKDKAGFFTVMPVFPNNYDVRGDTKKKIKDVPITFVVKRPEYETAREATAAEANADREIGYNKLPDAKKRRESSGIWGYIGAGLYIIITVHPTNVNFQNVQIWEEDGTNSFSGLWQNDSSLQRKHKANPYPFVLTNKNGWADSAWYHISLSKKRFDRRKMEEGKLIWTIPVKWSLVTSDGTKPSTAYSLPTRTQTHEVKKKQGDAFSLTESKKFLGKTPQNFIQLTKTDAWTGE